MVQDAISHLSMMESHITAVLSLMNLMRDRGVPHKVALSPATADGAIACADHCALETLNMTLLCEWWRVHVECAVDKVISILHPSKLVVR